LSDKDGIHLYIEYLFGEYTIENILALIEYIQWIRMNDNISDINIQFCNEVPLSYINITQEYNWYDKIVALYNKYITEFCEFQINVGFGIRNEFETLIELYQFKQSYQERQNITTIDENEGSFVILGDIGEFVPKHTSFDTNISSILDTKDDEEITLNDSDGSSITNETIITDDDDDSIIIENNTTPNNINKSLRKPMDLNIETHSDGLAIKQRKMNLQHLYINKPNIDNTQLKLAYKSSSNPTPIKTFNKPGLKDDDKSETLLSHKKAKSFTKNPDKNTSKNRKRFGSFHSQNIKRNLKRFSNKIKNKLSHSTNNDMSSIKSHVLLEQNMLKRALNTNKDDFVNIINQTISVLIDLNYQSLKRFSETMEFQRWFEANQHLFIENKKKLKLFRTISSTLH